LPDWATTHPGAPDVAPGPLVPSDLGGAKIVEGGQDGADLDAALRHGRQIHRLLEFLPAYDRGDWPRIARDLLAFGEDAAPPDRVESLLGELSAVLDNPDLAPLFAPGTLAEVELSAPVDIVGRTRIHGIIDRLIIGPDRVLAVDFKTNQSVPASDDDIPEGILRQLGAYEMALRSIYPTREIETAVLWTSTGRLMKLSPGLALRAFGRLDGMECGS
jgi:ATP-dependent helicase/nuclease subunit A